MKKRVIPFVIIGAGWRGLHYLRIARELPDYFKVEGVFVRDSKKGEALEKEWGVKTFQSIDELLKRCQASFVVLAVPPIASYEYIVQLASTGVPVLAETPPCEREEDFSNLSGLLRKGMKIQVAEEFPSRKWDGPSRKGLPEQQEISGANQLFARFSFGGKVGILDFDGGQYAGGWIRAQRTYIRGEKGELSDRAVRYMKDFRTPVELHLIRQDSGHDASTKEGFGHKMYLLGEKEVSRSPFRPARQMPCTPTSTPTVESQLP